MNETLIVEKFGNKYSANEDTYHMGIHHVLGNAIAKRFEGRNVCLDACLGAGFMTFQLAKYVDKVIGVDINSAHLNDARENLRVANIGNKCELIEGDILNIIESLEFDSAFLDPDWAKIGDSKEKHVLELFQMVPPADILLNKVFEKTKNVCLRLPKSFDISKLGDLPTHESEAIYQSGNLKFYCIYFGDLVAREGSTQFRA